MIIDQPILPFRMLLVHPSLGGVWWKEDELLHFQESPPDFYQGDSRLLYTLPV